MDENRMRKKTKNRRRVAEKKLRLGVVPYLNVKPLIWGIEAYENKLEMLAAVPRELARRLRAGLLDVAIVPVVEYFRGANYRIVPSLAIACRGAARSIMFLSKKPISQIRTVLADRSSLTSVNLLRVLLREHFKVSARVKRSPKPLKHDEEFMKKSEDAFLIIGDAALKIDLGQFRWVYDLGEEWFKFSGLPFVFAVWTVRKNVNLNGLDRSLVEMKKAGSRRLCSIARKASSELGLSETMCYNYLRKNIRHDLGNEEIRGMKLFYRMLVKHKLCRSGVRIRFYHPRTRSAQDRET
jgi:chorismate dehydratase